MRLHVPITLRWSDLDAYGHVNNAEMLRLLEEARISAFWSADDSAIDDSVITRAGIGDTAIGDGAVEGAAADGSPLDRSSDEEEAADWEAGGGGHRGRDRSVSTAILDGRPGAGTLTLIARLEVEYLAPIPYLRQPLDVQLWLGRLGGASFEVCYEVWSPESAEPRILFARAATTIVLVDALSQRPRRLTDPERAAWSPYLGDPVQFTTRK